MSAPLGYADKLVTIHRWLAIDSNRLPAIVCCMLAVTTLMVSSRNLVVAQETPVASVETNSNAGPAATTEAAPDYAGTLKPFLTTHCASCHLNGEAEAGIDLSRFEDAKSLLKDRLMWERVAEVITAGTMPPEDATKRPANEEVVAVCNALTQYYQFIDRTAKPDPGRVTMRRLNRVEYRNTVRDLFGLDFDPTEEFPSDDIGHGFDNIGDVLTISPLLMERYLKASESIATRVIVEKPPPVNRNHLQARFTEPAAKEIPLDGSFRVLKSDGENGLQTGPIFTGYKFEDEGEYEFRARVFARAPEGQKVEMVILLQGEKISEADSDEALSIVVGEVRKSAKILHRAVVTGRTPEKSEVIEVKLPKLVGRERILVGLVKPSATPQEPATTEAVTADAAAPPAEASATEAVIADAATLEVKPAELLVEYLSLKGPMDSRPLAHKQWLAHPAELQGIERNRHLVTRWLKKIYRRPPTDQEVEALASLALAEEQAGTTWEGSMQFALQAALSSPKFLFRVELDDQPQSHESRAIDQFALANRLSYFLWSTMPDERLFELAEKGELEAKLDEEIQRMLKDDRATSLVDQFALQWLQLQRLDQVQPDRDMFPDFNDELRRAMKEETRLLFLHILKEDRSILEVVDASYTFLNERLARFYGIRDDRGNEDKVNGEQKGEPIQGRDFRLVQLPAGSTRGGLLTHASILTVTSNPTRTSPVKRGRWVLEQVLGAPPPPPPPDAPQLPVDAQAVASGSLRQRLEIHRANPSCANCHDKMDPIGFALENYDAVGRFRTKDGAFDIDASGVLPDGSKFNNLPDLKQILKNRSRDVARCMAEKMLIFAIGRGVEFYDRPTINKIVESTEANGYRFSALVKAIVASEPFRMRREME
jgi:hypothetical protein